MLLENLSKMLCGLDSSKLFNFAEKSAQNPVKIIVIIIGKRLFDCDKKICLGFCILCFFWGQLFWHVPNWDILLIIVYWNSFMLWYEIKKSNCSILPLLEIFSWQEYVMSQLP